jgi:cell wall-associated NlpC family hydrolase
MTRIDPRLHPYRDDLAAESLRGRVEAPAYAEGRPMQVAAGYADLRRRPDDGAPLDSQLLFGEEVLVFAEADGWAWVQNKTDRYVGYARCEALSDEVHTPTHVVSALRTFVFPEPDLKAPPLHALSMASNITLTQRDGAYCRIATGGWIYARHLVPLDDLEPDYVATAQTFIGVPYLWGGRSSLGLDCSALIQLALARAGVVALRDSDQQGETLGDPLDWVPSETRARRGDLLFSPGHVAIVYDEDRVLNANAHAMAVSIEPWRDLEARVIAESGGGFTGRRRPRVG